MKTIWFAGVGLVAAAILMNAAPLAAQGDELLVSNVQVQQQPFSSLVHVTYDLETVGDAAVAVSLSLSTDGGATFPHSCTAVTGDVGAGVAPGVGKQITWDAGLDFPAFADPDCVLRVTADDGVSGAPAGFVTAPAGVFQMGSPADELGRDADEPLHQVTLTHGFHIQATEVTNQQLVQMLQWAYDQGHVTAAIGTVRSTLDGSTQPLTFFGPSYELDFNGGVFSCVNPGLPAVSVTWHGAAAYCDWLSLQQGLPRAYNHVTWQCNGGNPYTAQGYRLPTEAEWEYACRAGSATAFANGPITERYCTPVDPNLDQMGWYCANTLNARVSGAQKQPNAWGLYDMHGNVWEWVNDWYWSTYFGAETNPVGVSNSTAKVIRGGAFTANAASARSASRSNSSALNSPNNVGFRPVRSTD